MPLIKVETNVSLDEPVKTAQHFSSVVADMLGKPESYVLTIVEHDKTMLFGGEDSPAAFVTLDSIGLPEDRTEEFSAALAVVIQQALGVVPERAYISFGSIDRHLLGWSRKTFK
ncbi:MAG: hypothetical protein CL942_14005 [Desulfovibrio sp.]|nr:hypothetical protein [Desulfovibrio sp.]|tara:strand:- start:1121 stop:1462 length:342 start_codon:yes stop_codon:yes gene_type:complete